MRALEYERRRPEETPLYQIVRDHLDTFLAHAREHHNKGIPKYVESELRAYLKCGILAHGVAHAQCKDCGREIVVAFSCKRRGPCPSCAARRMCHTAANLVDLVFPDVPVRQWVLSVPFELRLLLASRPDALTAVGRFFTEEVFRWQRERAQVAGVNEARGGAVAFHHRFGGSLNLHTHYHLCALDGVFARADPEAEATFHRTPAPRQLDIDEITHAVHIRVLRWLKRKRLIRDPDDEQDPNEPRTPSALQACLQGSLGMGRLVSVDEGRDETARITGQGPLREPKRHQRDGSGYSLHAGVVIAKGDREARERLFRYCARAPLSLDRLRVTDEGQVIYRVRNAHQRSRTHRVMTPVDFLARLAALIPPPRHPLVRYHGVLAPHSSWRASIVPGGHAAAFRLRGAQSDATAPDTGTAQSATPPDAVASSPDEQPRSAQNAASTEPGKPEPARNDPSPSERRTRRIDWATLLKRVYDIDAMRCPCGGRLKFLDVVTESEATKALLDRLDLAAVDPSIGTRATYDSTWNAPPPDW